MNRFRVGDLADHKSGTLDPRPVAAVIGPRIVLQIGTVQTPPLPHSRYNRIRQNTPTRKATT